MKRTFGRTGLIVILLLVISFQTYSQQQKDINVLDSYISKAVKDFSLPGMAVGIVKNGQVIFTMGYGVRDIRTGEPVTPETVFGVASVTKAFTAACIGMLVDEGKLKWDDKVTDYLPSFQMNDAYATKEMTIRDLLCHRSGLVTFDGDLNWYGTNYSRKEIVRRIRYIPLRNGFRYKYGYQNLMFITAGEVIEAVTGKTWDQFVKERIFEPLGMNLTNTSTSEFSQEKNWALPHVDGKPQSFINYDNSGGAAAINSSISDLLKWAQIWLNKGQINGKRILSEESVAAITSPQFVLNSGTVNEKYGIHFRSYGLGWFLMDYSGRKVIEHTGGLPGFISEVAFVPEDSLGIAILSNEVNYLVIPVLRKILDFYLNDKDVDYAATALLNRKKSKENAEQEHKQREEKRIKNSSPSLPLKDYAGTYSDTTYGKAEITFAGDELTLKLIPSEKLLTSKMEYWHLNTFRIKFNDPFLPEGFVTFNFNSNGKVSGFKIDLPNPDFLFYNLDFRKL